MKNCYILLIVLSFPFVSTAQISLTAGMAPPLGSMFIYYDANVPTPAFTFSKSGTSNTWDFTTISPLPTEEDTVFIIDPATVPGSSAFPTATHSILESGNPLYTMLQIDATAATFLGGVGDLLGIGTPFATVIIPPFTAMTFPYTYGSTASGNGIIEIKTSGATIGQPMIDSIWFKSNVIAAHSVAAAGNMIVPAGTFPALLERQVTTTVDSAWIKSPLTLNMWLAAPGFPITTTDSSFNWYSDQSLQKFAHAIYDSTGISDVVFFKSSTTGIANPVSYEPVTLYPNPANNTIYFSNASMLQEMQLHLFDVNGKEVLQGYGHIEKLDVSKLSSGVYFLRMNSSGRPSHTYRIVKE